MKIKKVSGTAVLTGNVVDSLEDNSSTNAPSQRAVNEAISTLKEIATFYLTNNFTGSGTSITKIPLTEKVSNKKEEDSSFILQSDGTIKIIKDCDLEISCVGTFGSFTLDIVRRVGIVDSSNQWLTQFMTYHGGYISFSATPVYYRATANSILKFALKQDSEGNFSLTNGKHLTHMTIKEI